MQSVCETLSQQWQVLSKSLDLARILTDSMDDHEHEHLHAGHFFYKTTCAVSVKHGVYKARFSASGPLDRLHGFCHHREGCSTLNLVARPL